jgi:hypothetical protein
LRQNRPAHILRIQEAALNIESFADILDFVATLEG